MKIARMNCWVTFEQKQREVREGMLSLLDGRKIYANAGGRQNLLAYNIPSFLSIIFSIFSPALELEFPKGIALREQMDFREFRGQLFWVDPKSLAKLHMSFTAQDL